MVCPWALMAATPVGASTTIRLGVRSLKVRKNVVLPVPAFPVRNTDTFVLEIKRHAKFISWFCTPSLSATCIENTSSCDARCI